MSTKNLKKQMVGDLVGCMEAAVYELNLRICKLQEAEASNFEVNENVEGALGNAFYWLEEGEKRRKEILNNDK